VKEPRRGLIRPQAAQYHQADDNPAHIESRLDQERADKSILRRELTQSRLQRLEMDAALGKRRIKFTQESSQQVAPQKRLRNPQSISVSASVGQELLHRSRRGA
jgi:hypothetical protein